MSDYIDIILLVLSFILSAFYSGSEAALVSIPLDRARQLIEAGGTKGRALSFLTSHTNEVMNTILIGNNLVNIFAASLTTQIFTNYFDHDALAYSVGLTTFMVLIFGEITPKTFARTHAESLAAGIINILKLNYYVFYPIVWLLTRFIETILGKNAQLRGRVVTKQDVEYLISRAEKQKSMDTKQIDLLSSILEFPRIKVKDIMIPRSQVMYIKTDQGYDEILKYAREDAHSRYPVCDDDLDNTIGFLHIKDLAFVTEQEKKNFKVQDHIKVPFFVYEHMKIQAVFDHMNRKKVHLALVKDENGLVVGIVTLEDIMEEIFGEIVDEHDDDEDIRDIPDNIDMQSGIDVVASISLRDLDSDYNIHIPLNDNYSTLGGFILDMIGNNFPKKEQIVFWEGFSFELTDVENDAIKTIRIRDVEGEKHLFKE